MSDLKDVLVPDVGGEEVEIIEVCVEKGDSVEAEQSLITVESDKASMDIPAPFAGNVAEIKVSVGDKVSQDDLIMQFEAADDAASSDDSNDDDGDDSAAESDAENQSTADDAADKSDASPSSTSRSDGDETVEVTVPDIGDESDVEIIEVLVSVGDEVAEEDGLITLETDKATMDVPAPRGGKVKELKVKTGDKVSEGSLILILEASGSNGESQDNQKSETKPSQSDDQDSNDAEAASETKEVSVPDIGDESDVEVIEVLVSEGDDVAEEEGLITLETDKATMDVPAPFAGKVEKLKVKVGDKVSQGDLIAMVTTQGSASSSDDRSESESTPSPSSSSTSSKPSGENRKPPVPHHPSAGDKQAEGKVHASPAVRRVAREFGVDLTQVKGSGRKGRILKEDVQSYVKYELSRPKATAGSVGQGEGGLQVIAPPKVDHSKFGDVEEVPLTRIQKISGPNLHRNWVTIPHVTQFEEADITEVEAFRKEQNKLAEKKKRGVKITPLVFIMKAAADALKAYPVFNTSLSESGESLIQKKYYHIGIAVDTPNGLVVPVVRDVDKKGIFELSEELTELSKKARDGKLKSADMQGSCFTISSLGGIGGTAFTPIVNAPDVAILGVSRSEMKPKWNGEEFEPRLMLPLSLSYDHRVIDGAVAARFAVHLSRVLTDIREMLL